MIQLLCLISVFSSLKAAMLLGISYTIDDSLSYDQDETELR